MPAGTDIVERNDSFIWNPVYGRTYSLYPEEVHAVYLGSRDGKRYFFRENGGKLFVYTSPSDEPVYWWGDCDEGPFLPGFRAESMNVLNQGAEKDLVLGILRKHEQS